LVIGLVSIISFSQAQITPLNELKQIGSSLKQIHNIEYQYRLKSFSSISGDSMNYNGKIYFEKNSKDTLLGYNFFNNVDLDESFYNGVYLIQLSLRDSSAFKKSLCDYRDGHMTLYPFLELSYAAINNFLTDSLLDSRIYSLSRKDTVINNISCRLFSFWADNMLIDTHKKNKRGRKKVKLAFHKSDNLPVYYSQFEFFKQKTKDISFINEALYKNYSFNSSYQADNFSIESVPSFYKWDKYKSYFKLLPIGVKAPNWKLPSIYGDSLLLSSLIGNVVLLDFWFIGCGSCIQSIPTLNNIQAKYKDKRIIVVGINLHSNKVEKIREYCKNNEMNYTNVWNGNTISNQYIVNAAPIFYLIDKEGKIVYSQVGHDSAKLQKVVDDIMGEPK